MRRAEACTLLADVLQELAQARGERNAWRCVAMAAIHYGHDLHGEIERVRAAYHRLLDESRSQRHREAA